MTPSRFILILLFVNFLSITSRAGVIGSLALESDRVSCSQTNSDPLDYSLGLSAQDGGGMSNVGDTPHIEIPFALNVLSFRFHADEVRQGMVLTPTGVVPKPTPDPLLKVPI